MNRFVHIYALLLSSFVVAQTTINVSVDTNKALIGDLIQLDLNVQTKESILWPDIEGLINPVEVQKLGVIDSVSRLGKSIYHQNISIQHFDTGTFVLPQIPFVNFNGDTFYSDSIIKISFIPVVLDTANIVFDIKEPKDVPFNFSEAKPYIYGSLIFLLIILLGYYLIQRFRQKIKVEEEQTIEQIPCDEEAIQALKNLESKALCEKGSVKKHYVQLTEILRRYFDRAYHIDTLESTTDEIIDYLKDLKVDVSLLTEITELLNEADFVKFAKSSPDKSTNDRFMNSSYRIVEECQKMNEEVEDV